MIKVAFTIFILLSIYSTASKTAFYPFNPYAMFSRNWLKHNTMPEIKIQDAKGALHSVWQNTSNPFFQVNRFALLTYVDLKNPVTREQLCQWFRKNLATNEISILGLMNKYTRENSSLKIENLHKEELYKCQGQI